MRNRPFARSGHVVRNKLCWGANNAVGLTKERNVGLDWYEFLCFETSIIYPLPCDPIVQRAYCVSVNDYHARVGKCQNLGNGNWFKAHQFYGKSQGKFNIFLFSDLHRELRYHETITPCPTLSSDVTRLI